MRKMTGELKRIAMGCMDVCTLYRSMDELRQTCVTVIWDSLVKGGRLKMCTCMHSRDRWFYLLRWSCVSLQAREVEEEMSGES